MREGGGLHIPIRVSLICKDTGVVKYKRMYLPFFLIIKNIEGTEG